MSAGAWLSTDPLGVAGGLNLYGLDGAPSDVADPLGLSVDGKSHRREQTDGDVTYGTEAIRRHGVSADAPYEATPVYGKNDNLKGPKGEPSERITTINSEGDLVEFDHHSNGHYFKDTNEYELPHYHGPQGDSGRRTLDCRGELTGTVTNAGTTRILTVDMIRAAEGTTIPVSEIRNAIPSMLNDARASGVQVLQIDASLANPRLQSFVFNQTTRYGGTAASVGVVT